MKIKAVKNGKCVDTSMGLTPLEGLIMGTRCGDIDPAIVEFIAKRFQISDRIYPYFSILSALAIALTVALISIKFEYSIVVIVMAWIGGFAAVNYLNQILTTGPINLNFISKIPFWGWYFLQAFLSLLGMLKQGVGED